MNVKVNDTVHVLTGRYKDKQGKVLKADPKTGRVIVEGINIVSKHRKARKANEQSKIVKEESYIDASNVMVICPYCNKPTRVYRMEIDGKLVRYHGGKKGCGKPLDVVAGKKSKKAAPAPVEEAAPKKRTRKRSQKAAEAAEAVAPETEKKD